MRAKQFFLAAAGLAVLAAAPRPAAAPGCVDVPPPYAVPSAPGFVEEVVAQPVLVTPPPVVVAYPVIVRPDLSVTTWRITWLPNIAGHMRRVIQFEVRNTGLAPAAPSVASVSIGGAAPAYV